MTNDNEMPTNAINPNDEQLLSNSTSDPAKIVDHSGENKLPAPNEHALDTANTASNNDMQVEVNKGGGYLELLEERPVVNKERLDVGRVIVTKHTRTKTIEVPIELVEEYITVTTSYQDSESKDLLLGRYDEQDILRHVEPALDSKAVVTINGQQVTIGDVPVEIVLSRQVATITKETYAIQEIAVNKTVHTHTDSIQVELKHEELDVKEEGFLAHENATNATRADNK